MNPQIHQKSMKIQPWTPRCPRWCPCGPMDHQHGHPRAKIKPPRYQNGASRSPKLKFRIKLIIHVTNQLVNSYLLTGGRRQGRSLKIYIFIYIYINIYICEQQQPPGTLSMFQGIVKSMWGASCPLKNCATTSLVLNFEQATAEVQTKGRFEGTGRVRVGRRPK
jgi:hypothetical protein